MALPLLLFAIALVARTLSAMVFGDPAYPDSFYYVNVAHQLAAGNGFQVDYIWNFVDVGGKLPADPMLPIPSNAHWMPLAVLIQIPFIWILGPTMLASSLPFWILGALAAPVTWAIARDAGMSRGQQAAGGLMAALPGGVAPFLSQPDNFGLFMTLGSLSLWCCARGLRGDRPAFVVGGAIVGLATLSRNDGLLLGVPFALAFLLELARRRPAAMRIGWRAALLCAALFVLVMTPWWLRQVAVFGTPSPSGASGRILWIADYRELYSISGEPTLASFLARGPGPILGSRLAGLVSALTIFTAMPLLFFLTPFTLIGAWMTRRDPAFAPWLVYAVSLFTFSALLFAVHVPYGTFLHSAVALLPHAYLVSLLGVAAAVRWIAARRTTWDADHAVRIFTATAVLGVMGGAVAGSYLVIRGWQDELEVRAPIVAALADIPVGERLMSPDAGGYRYLAGRMGIVTPDDPLAIVESALRAYEIRWLVLERDHIVPALAPLLAGDMRPVWLSEPLIRLAPADVAPGTIADEDVVALSRLPRAALFAVCLQPPDPRCSP